MTQPTDVFGTLPSKRRPDKASKMLQREAVRCAANGGSEQDLLRWAEQQSLLPQVYGKHLLAEVRSSHRSALRWVAKVEAELRPWREAVTALKLPGSRSKLRVLLALLEIAQRAGLRAVDGVLTVSASQRQIAERAVMGRGTATTALDALHSLGLVARIPSESYGVADSYALVLASLEAGAHESDQTRTNLLTPSCVSQMVGSTLIGSDRGESASAAGDELHVLWSYKGLGAKSYAIWSTLTNEPRSPKALSLAAPCGEATAHRQLKALQTYGLARRVRGGWVAADCDLDAAAEALGVLDRREVLAKRHAQEREVYDDWRRRQTPATTVDPFTGEVASLPALGPRTRSEALARADMSHDTLTSVERDAEGDAHAAA